MAIHSSARFRGCSGQTSISAWLRLTNLDVSAMNANLRELLWLVGSGAVVGAAAGVAIRRFRPEWCRSWSKLQEHPKIWWVFLIGFLFFGLVAYSSLSEGNVPAAAFAAVFSAAELACLFWVRLRAAPPGDDR